VLRIAGRPLHASEILQLAERDFQAALDRDSIVCAILKKYFFNMNAAFIHSVIINGVFPVESLILKRSVAKFLTDTKTDVDNRFGIRYEVINLPKCIFRMLQLLRYF